MLLNDLLDLWRVDGYELTLVDSRINYEGSDWYLYFTNFEYQLYEYRRHYGILVETKDGVVTRSRILEYGQSGTINELVQTARNIMEMKWKRPDE